MAELLQNWLNNEVGLSTNIANFERDFANGYLFGEILHKFRQQDDFCDFENKNTYEAKIANFKRLEPTLKALGIKFNASHSNAMMGGERGASLRLLYQLKMATERLLLACNNPTATQGKSGTQQPPTTGVVTKGIRNPREKYDGHERRFFEHRLRATGLNVKQARTERVTRRFEEEKHKQELVAFEMDTVDQLRAAEQRKNHRYGQRERYKQKQANNDAWTVHCLTLWEQNMQTQIDREAQQEEFLNKTKRAQQDKLDRTKAKAASEVYDGIRVFEENLANSDQQASSTSKNNDLVDGLKAQMPSAAELEQEASLFLRKIKESKHAGSIARKERERRRRRVLVEQEREQELLEEGKLEEVLLEKLGRESAEEKRLNYTVWRTQRYADVIAQNRDLRQQGYKARRKEDQQQAKRRDQDLMEEMKETLKEQADRERVRYRAIENGKKARYKAELSETCEGILDLIADMAFASMQQEQLTDKPEVDETLWREWTQLFQENVPVAASQPLPACQEEKYPVSVVPLPDEEPSQPPDSILCKEAIKDYVWSRGQWEFVPLAADGSPIPSRTPDDGSPIDEHGHRSGSKEPAGSRLSMAPVVTREQLDLPAEMTRILDGPAGTLSFVQRLEREPDIVEGRPVNYRLGFVVAALLDRFHAQPPLPEPPPMPEVPVRIVLSGKPFAGKRTIAARLAESFNLQVVDVDEVVRECLHLSKRPDIGAVSPIDVLSFHATISEQRCEKSEEEGNPYVRELQTIGYEVQERMTSGLPLDSEMYVRIITTKIRSLYHDRIPQRQALGAGDAAADAAGTPPADGGPVSPDAAGSETPAAEPADGDGSVARGSADGAPAPDPLDSTQGGAAAFLADATDTRIADASEPRGEDSPLHAGADGEAPPDATLIEAEASTQVAEQLALEPSGWILLGFPDDAERLGLLERFLSGWVAPNARPATEAELKKREAALLAPRPPEEPPPFELTPGGYDLHFRLEVSGDEAVRRAMGRRVDPVNGLFYHLEDDPPCFKNQIIYERLKPVDDLTNSMGSLTHRIHSFDTAQSELDAVLAYFGPFPDVLRLSPVDANGSQDSVYDSVAGQVTDLLNRKDPSRLRRTPPEPEATQAVPAAGEPTEAEPPADDAAEAAADADVPGAPSTAASPDRPADASAQGASSATPGVPPSDAGEKADPELEKIVPAKLPTCVEKLEDQVFHLLLSEWEELQTDFTTSVRTLYTWHRTHLADFRSGLYGIQQRYLEFLQRPDDKQELVNQFVERFNRFTEEYPDMRKQESCKEELHQQVDDLHEQLLSKVNQQKTDNLQHLEDIRKSGWVEAQAEAVAAQVQHAIQLEAKRYHATCQLLTDFYFGAMGMVLPEPAPLPPKIDALGAEDPSAAGDAAPDTKKKGAKDKKKDDAVKVELDGPEARAARIRRRTGSRWEFPFLDELLLQAQRVLWPLTEFTPPGTTPAPTDGGDPKAKAKAKAKGKTSPVPGEAPDGDQAKPAPALYVDLQQALLAERVAFTHRLSITRNWAERRLTHLSEAATHTFIELEDWSVIRRQKNVEALHGLVDALKEHVEDEKLIVARLTLDGAHLQRHPNVLLKAPKPEPIPPAVEAEVSYRWSIDQLGELLEMTSCLANGGGVECRVLPVPALMSMLLRLTQATSGDVSAAEQLQVQVPKAWRGCDAERLLRLCGIFDHPPRVGAVDCVEFLFHIGLMHSPLGWPSLDTLMEVRAHIEKSAPPPPGARWPDYYVPDTVIRSSPLFADPARAEAALANKYKTDSSKAPGLFDRSQAQMAWVTRVLQTFPAPLRQYQAWQLEASWYDFSVRSEEERERRAELLDDVKSTPSASPPSPAAVDAMVDLMGAGPDTPLAAESIASGVLEPAAPRPPRPEAPQVVQKPDPSYISVRQFLSYLCQGNNAEEGFARTMAVLGPGDGSSDHPVSMVELHAALLQFGARPMPVPDADGRPRMPSLEQMCEALEQENDARFTPADFLALPGAPRFLDRLGFQRRHTRVEVEKLFPKSLKSGTRLPPDDR